MWEDGNASSGLIGVSGKQLAIVSKGEDVVPLRGDSDSRNQPSGDSRLYTQGHTCTRMFNVALCITAKKRKQST